MVLGGVLIHSLERYLVPIIKTVNCRFFRFCVQKSKNVEIQDLTLAYSPLSWGAQAKDKLAKSESDYMLDDVGELKEFVV